MATAPKNRVVLLYAPNAAGDGDYAVAVWFFGGWGLTHPVLGDPVEFEPTL